MRLNNPKKILATGAALLGIMLGAAGIAAATTGSGSSQPAPASVHAQQSTGTTADTPEANDVPDKSDANDKTEHEDGANDANEVDGQG